VFDPENGDPTEEDWCEKCDRVVEIVDRFDDVVQEYAGQRGGRVIAFDCGHSLFTPDGTFYPFP
jgi:hypothetical protein